MIDIRDGEWKVYGLISPKSGWVFYVGMTKDMHQRIIQHRNSGLASAAVSVVVSELKACGLHFGFCVFGCFDTQEEAAVLERSLIQALPSLCNVVYSVPLYESRVADDDAESWGRAEGMNIPFMTPKRGPVPTGLWDKTLWQRDARAKKKAQREIDFPNGSWRKPRKQKMSIEEERGRRAKKARERRAAKKEANP